MMPDTPQLNYAPRLPMHRRRVFRWWFCTVVLLGIAGSGYWWAPPAWRRTQLLYWQHACAIYTAPNDQLVYDETNHSGVKVAAWSNFYTIISPPGSRSDATLFLHEMRKPNGERRLVAVDVDEVNWNSLIKPREMVIEAWARVFKLGTLTEQPQEAHGPYDRNYSPAGYGEILNGTKVYAASTDPADATHFTFHTSDENGEHIYDGWLQDDDSVAIGERRMAKSSR